MSKLAINGGPKAAAALENVKWPILTPDDEAALVQALRDNYWGGLGDDNLPNRIFEREFSKYHDTKYGITVANGTLTLELSLRAGGIKPGDEVLVPAITFVASATAIVSVGAIPVFVDVDPTPARLAPKRSKKQLRQKPGPLLLCITGDTWPILMQYSR